MPQGEGGKMGNVLKAEVRQALAHTKTVLSPEHKAAIRKGETSLAASRAASLKAEACSKKSK
jgi:hypothetical protein